MLLSHKKEQVRVSCSEMDEPRACYTEWRKSEREKPILYTDIYTYIWNLEKWYWLTYLQERNVGADVENRFVDTLGGKGRGRNGETSLDIHTLACVEEIAGGKLLYNTGSRAWCLVMT